MFKTKTLMVIIFILGSAVAVKAGVFYSFGMPGTDVGADRSEGVRNENSALGGVSGKFSSLFALASSPASTTSTPGTTAKEKRIEFSCALR
jgi:hypothetical protein